MDTELRASPNYGDGRYCTFSVRVIDRDGEHAQKFFMLRSEKTGRLNKCCKSYGHLLQVIKQAGGLSYQDLMREKSV